jgi:hypothetical protein
MDDQNIQQQPYLTFFDDDTAEYDVIVDQSSSAPNLKEATWGALQPLLPLVSERMGEDEFGLILEYSPLPESFLEKFKAIAEKKAQQPPPPDPEMMKIQAMQQAKQAELQMKQQEAQVQMQMDQQAAQHQAQVEQGKVAAQIQLEREKAAAQIQLEREKAQAQLELEKMKMVFEAERMKQEMQFKAISSRHDMALKTASTQSKMNMDASKAAETETEDDDDGTAEAITQMSEAIMQLAQSTSDGIASLGADIKDAMTKPKTIVRGPDGRATGVQ